MIEMSELQPGVVPGMSLCMRDREKLDTHSVVLHTGKYDVDHLCEGCLGSDLVVHVP